MISKKLTNILLILSVAIFLFGSGYRLGEFRANNQKVEGQNYNLINADNNKKNNIDFSLFWETWQKVEEKYVDKKKLNAQKMFYGAIKGMVATMEDPYTFFLTPEENKQSKADLDGKFEGIGAQLDLKENQIIIVAPLKESPAEKVGIKAGDIILEVNDESIKGWTLLQVVSKIRGKKGTKVKLTINHAGKEKTFEIIRDVIKISSVELGYEKPLKENSNKVSSGKKDQSKTPGNIAYLKLNQFGTNTNEEWDLSVGQIVKKWNNKEIKGMILDLRNNPGGYLDSSVYLASEFLPKGDLVVKQESSSSTIETREYKVARTGKLLNIPLVILVNKGSASASEILSGALRDHNRAKLIGEKTFGKGSVQEALNLSNDAGLHVTVAKWILPNGDWIMGKGIEPDIKVENKVENGNSLTRETDLQLERAVGEILK